MRNLAVLVLLFLGVGHGLETSKSRDTTDRTVFSPQYFLERTVDSTAKIAHYGHPRLRKLKAEEDIAEPTPPANWLLDSEEEVQRPRQFAYAAVLLSDNDSGIRTLGESLIRSGTTIADFVALVGPTVTAETASRLVSQGWMVKRLELEQPSHVDGNVIVVDDGAGAVTEELAHIAAWSLTQYQRVVLLADNMLVMENIDDLFQCPGTCAVMQQAELISASLVVLEPNEDMFEHMTQTAHVTYSYSGTFQGFLNSYMAGFEYCTLFDLENPFLQNTATDPKRGRDAEFLDHTCNRLPTRYNGELSLVMLNGGLGMVRTKNPMPDAFWQQRNARVVRFGFAGLRPWMWYAAPFLPYVSAWEDVHRRAHPRDPSPSLIRLLAVWLGFILGGFVLLRTALRPSIDGYVSSWRKGKKNAASASSGGAEKRIILQLLTKPWIRRKSGGPNLTGFKYNPRGLVWSVIHLAYGYGSLGVAIVIGAWQVPKAASVWLSWLVFITWTCTVFGTLWSLYLSAVSFQARHSPKSGAQGTSALDLGQSSVTAAFPPGVLIGNVKLPSTNKSGRDLSKPRVESMASPWTEGVRSLGLLALAMTFLPSWKCLSGAGSLGTILGPVVVAVLGMLVGLTVQMIRLPVLWCDRSKGSAVPRGGSGLYK